MAKAVSVSKGSVMEDDGPSIRLMAMFLFSSLKPGQLFSSRAESGWQYAFEDAQSVNTQPACIQDVPSTWKGCMDIRSTAYSCGSLVQGTLRWRPGLLLTDVGRRRTDFCGCRSRGRTREQGEVQSVDCDVAMHPRCHGKEGSPRTGRL